MTNIILYLFVTYCIINLLRIATYLISSDFYRVRQLTHKNRAKRKWHTPTVTVVVPAHNEEATIVRCLTSLYSSNYPASKYEVIVVNDGSTDMTKDIVNAFKQSHRDRCKFRLINVPNKGKARALNYAIRRYARGTLVMCLDSDSYLHKNALRSAAQYFRNRKVVALSANVNIIEDGTLLALAQRIEYLMGYHMKKGQDSIGIDYIIGGIGSMFRRTMLKKVGLYDTNTMTEDIDLTMKILATKGRQKRIVYAADAIAYTEAVHSVSGLMKQRFRWKYGRSQTFFKNSRLFFSSDNQQSKRITWFMMPFVLFQDFIFFFEPILTGYFIYTAIYYHSLDIFMSALLFFTAYVLFNIWSSDHLTIKERIRLTYYAPPMYLLIYPLAFADYYALVKGTWLLPQIRTSLKARHLTWHSPERKPTALTT